MEIRTYKVYKFDELAEDIQDKVVATYYDINVDYFDWWECIFYDLKNNFQGITALAEYYPFVTSVEVKSFDLYRNRHADIVAEIEDKELFKHLFKGHRHLDTLLNLLDSGYIYEGHNGDFITSGNAPRINKLIEDIDLKEITRELSDDIALMLQREYDSLVEREAIIDTIRANEYDFTIEGKMD